jgi:hypothetical protein
MAEELGDAAALHEWLFCKEQLGKLCAERCQLEERLRDVRELIQSLQAIRLIPAKEENEDDENENDEQHQQQSEL